MNGKNETKTVQKLITKREDFNEFAFEKVNTTQRARCMPFAALTLITI